MKKNLIFLFLFIVTIIHAQSNKVTENSIVDWLVSPFEQKATIRRE